MSRFRTLAVLRPTSDPEIASVTFPAAATYRPVEIMLTHLPPELAQRVRLSSHSGGPVRAHCVANLAATLAEDFEPTDWEVS